MRWKTRVFGALAVVAAGLAAAAPGEAADVGGPGRAAVTVVRPEGAAPIAFAADEVCSALTQAGYKVAQATPDALDERAPAMRVVLAVRDSAAAPAAFRAAGGKALKRLRPQGYAIRRTGDAARAAWWVFGADAIGAMYGGLHVAEAVRIEKGGLAALAPGDHHPAIARRGIKFNIPLDARTPSYDDSGDAAQRNIAEMWRFDFWREFLDEMARHRYNTLTLWNPHPFPSLVKLPGYPDVPLADVCVTTLKPTHVHGRFGEHMGVSRRVLDNLKVVRRMSIDEKIAFWRRVMRHAADRGIDVYFITWNILINSAKGKYGLTDAQDNPKTIAYIRECTRELILTYPLLKGIGVTAGERMRKRDDEFAKEKWLWKAYGLGVLDAKKQEPDRKVHFIHRVWQTGLGEVMDEFGRKYPDPFEVSFKYARARLYSSPKPPFAEGLCKELKRHRVRSWWNLRNDDIFVFRWGDPDYVRAFLKDLPPAALTAGYYMGSDGYVWGREFVSRSPEKPRRLEIRKHWYRFMLWGRLGYDPGLGRAHFVKVLAARFPGADAGALYDAWQRASKIVPLVNRFHWRNWDFMWAVEGCMDQRHGFHTVRDFLRNPTMAGSGLATIEQYVKARRAGKKPAGTPPPAVADELAGHADFALAAVDKLRAAAPSPGRELRLTLGDIEAFSHLGRYYAAKIRGAVALALFQASKDARHKAQAVEHLQAAVGHWSNYAAVAARQYRPQLLARTRRLDWNQLLDEVKKDVEIARRARPPR